MPIHHAIWKVSSAQPQRLQVTRLQNEALLEDMIVAQIGILSEQWMLIGRQIRTGSGGRIDLLAIAPDGVLILIELKRDRTPRDVVAQAIDYASWVGSLQPEDITTIYREFKHSNDVIFADDFRQRFGQPLDEIELNQSHQIVIVASALDDSTERIIKYLSERGIPINVLFFEVFNYGTDQLLSRSWLIEPERTQVNAAASSTVIEGPREWNGEFYANFGQGESRSWNEARKYGFISAGGGAWYSNTLQLLNPGDRVWVNIPGSGFVGVGRAKTRLQSAAEFQVKTPEGDRPALEVLTEGNYHRQFLNDSEQCEYFVPIEWLDTVPIGNAISEIGLFRNQNTVCKPVTPKWRSTVARLQERFQNWDAPPNQHVEVSSASPEAIAAI